jgi:uncharacterized membrane protein
MDMIAIFAFVVWFWLLVAIYGDLFRRHDISGWGKAVADEIIKLDQLKKSGSITDDEFKRLRAKLV